MEDYEKQWDSRLKIDTIGRIDAHSDEYRYPYEPTPYRVLERLALSDLIQKGDVVVDYGCGKGRVGFFLTQQTGADVIGLEYDRPIYQSAIKNQQSAASKPDFIRLRAEEYELPRKVNRCYFFNPFSIEILRKVMAKILLSYYAHPREMCLFFYYPSDEYVAYLMSVPELDFYDEIECDDLFEPNDRRERILVFGLPDYGYHTEK